MGNLYLKIEGCIFQDNAHVSYGTNSIQFDTCEKVTVLFPEGQKSVLPDSIKDGKIIDLDAVLKEKEEEVWKFCNTVRSMSNEEAEECFGSKYVGKLMRHSSYSWMKGMYEKWKPLITEKEMTVDEIEKELGYKIKIVSGKEDQNGKGKD